MPAKRSHGNVAKSEQAVKEHGIVGSSDAAKPINAEDEFWEQYGNDPEGLAEYYRKRDAYFRRLERVRRIKALPKTAKRAFTKWILGKSD